MLNQRLQQKLLQKLSPQQIQLIKLLEVPTLQLEQRIKKEIEENPALEEGSEDVLENNEDEISEEENIIDEQNEFSLEDYINEEDTPAYKLSSKNYSPDDEKKEIPFSIGSTFHEHLKSQLGLRILSEKQIVLADYIIGNIDEAGYLRRKPNEIVDDIVFAQGITTKEEEIDEILMIIQDFDPPGGKSNPIFFISRAKLSIKMASMKMEEKLKYVKELKTFFGQAVLANKIAKEGTDPYAIIWGL